MYSVHSTASFLQVHIIVEKTHSMHPCCKFGMTVVEFSVGNPIVVNSLFCGRIFAHDIKDKVDLCLDLWRVQLHVGLVGMNMLANPLWN